MFKTKQRPLVILSAFKVLTFLFMFAPVHGYSSSHIKNLYVYDALTAPQSNSTTQNGVQTQGVKQRPSSDATKSKLSAGSDSKIDETQNDTRQGATGSTTKQILPTPQPPRNQPKTEGTNEDLANQPTKVEPPKTDGNNTNPNNSTKVPQDSNTRSATRGAKQSPTSGTTKSKSPEGLDSGIDEFENDTHRSATGRTSVSEDMDDSSLMYLFVLLALVVLLHQTIKMLGAKRDAKRDAKAREQVSSLVAVELNNNAEKYHGTSLVSQEHLDKAINKIASHIEEIKQNSNNLKAEFDQMRHSFVSMNTALDQKDKRITDLEAGIDTKFKILFATSFMKPYQRLVDPVFANVDPTKTIEHIREFLKEAMILCDIEEVREEENTIFSPDSITPGRVKVVKQVQTDRKEYDRRIIEMHRPGYLLTLPSGGAKVISPCEVSIYVYHPHSGATNAK